MVVGSCLLLLLLSLAAGAMAELVFDMVYQHK
jgi:hypothetical protein